MKKLIFIIILLLILVNVSGKSNNINMEAMKMEYQMVKSTDFSSVMVDASITNFLDDNSDELIKVIVVLKEDGIEDYANENRAKRKQAIQMFSNKVVNDLNSMHILKQFAYTSTLYMEINKNDLETLRHHPDVKGVYEDMVMKTNIRDSVTQIEADSVWAEQVGAINITGEGQSVCVVGSGINYNHAGLGGGWGNVIIGGYDIMDDDSDPYSDVSSHETSVAGIIANQGSLGFADYLGVVPDSKIIAMRVSNGTGTWADALTAFEWCIDNASLYNISVIQYSSGTGTTIYTQSECQGLGLYDSWRQVILEAHSNDIMVVNSAGNTAGAGINKTGLGVHFPGCIPEMITVGGVADDDIVDYYTHAGEGLDFLAPDQVIAPQISGYDSIMGSSFAAPQVSGVIALLNQYSKLVKGYLVDYIHVIDIINKSGVTLYDLWADANYTRINASGVFTTFIDDSYPDYTEFTMNTTNFSALSLGDLDNITNPILENQYARIDWSGTDFNVDFMDIDSAVELTNNSVVVDSNVLPTFNTTANITMNGVSYDNINYYILKDGATCGDCVKIGYNPVKFSVTGFSTYTTGFTDAKDKRLIISDNSKFTLAGNGRLILKI